MFSEAGKGSLQYTLAFMQPPWPQKVSFSQRLGGVLLDQGTHGMLFLVATWGGRSYWDQDLKSIQRLYRLISVY